MARDKAYRRAEEMIEQTRRHGLTKLDLKWIWNAKGRGKLTLLPESLGQLTQLQTLDLSHNQLTALPESLSQLTQLQTLDLTGNQLIALPASLGQLTQLKTLKLSGNQLTALPTSLGQLTQLETLHLSRNQLTTLPEWLGQLTQLLTLDLSGNQLTKVPASLGQLTFLRILNLSYNRLVLLPETLGHLSQLRLLDVRRNRLKRMFASLGQLSNLERLYVYRNQLTTLPNSVGQLTHLKELHASHNRFKTLPDSLGELTKLELLNISDNRLQSLPDSLQNLKMTLRSVYVHNNGALGLPREIVGATSVGVTRGDGVPAVPAKILDYYFATHGEAGRELRELRLIVVGRGGAGKTTLVKRLNRKPRDPAESETHGINISRLELTCHDGPVTARVWDFGGQHVLHAMHEFFLTARSLYLLVLVEREDMAERDAAYWLQLIRSYAGSAPVVVAINKNEGRPREMDRETLEKNYGPILAWIPTECLEGFDETIENLRTALTDAADGMREVRDRFPRKWWDVKEWLEKMDEPYIDFAEYQKQCRELGEQDPRQQDKLAAWLNDLGIAINYAADERLHDTTVLRPDWLANGIYAILRANDQHHEKPLAPDALLAADRLGRIYAGAERLKMLEAVDYPEEMWPFLLRLMKLFQLAFPIDETGEKLLVPMLLPIEPLPGCDEPDDKDRTRLRYEFNVVPGPLLPKLLVRTFSLIEGERRWRRGAILRYGDARARVWATQDERWLHITAVGNQEDRDELLTMVRATLRELFAEYKNLHVVEQWEDEGDWVPRRRLEREGKLPVEDDREEVE